MSHSRALLALAVLCTACGDNRLGDAFFENTVDTLTISSLEGTPVSAPSAYSIPDDRLVRPDLTTGFDFVYLVRDGRHLLIPLDALGLGGRGSNPGLQQSTAAFDALVDPPTSGYVSDDSVAVAVGDVLVARSRIACVLSVPQYAKLEVLAIDAAARTLTFRVMANTNCGYRQLGPGIPRN
ncbi:MAG: hypothetical protein KC544_04140 [Gemmatimonadetes bacterium]|nr:hypothetical protein [Gemmatimonadota bacterium]MCB9504934.1 hypothetical protein [Gemmatimonadales bacterium]MCA9762303.1 hypothetical protein [Gemmatimonadota bacterium]MCA9768710.1 hypothetical protein [Gemmatimonadota bacterium]MCB9518253.1 hypothetical protein [Gemmatimonadales bacterium]